mgnify:CR=1 FL=1
MIDYLLKFKSEKEAVTFAEKNGFTSTDTDEDGKEVTTIVTQGEGYVFTVIGEHWTETGKTKKIKDGGLEFERPVMKSDKKHWVLFRDVNGDMDPDIAKKFVVWSSNMTEKVRARQADGTYESDDPETVDDEAWIEQPVPRPTSAPNRVFL